MATPSTSVRSTSLITVAEHKSTNKRGSLPASFGANSNAMKVESQPIDNESKIIASLAAKNIDVSPLSDGTYKLSCYQIVDGVLSKALPLLKTVLSKVTDVVIKHCQDDLDPIFNDLTKHSSNLKSIFVEGSDRITDIAIQNLKNLHSISLIGCTKTSPENILALVGRCSELVNLNLAGTTINTVAKQIIDNCGSSLTSLAFSDITINKEFINTLARRSPGLTSLRFFACTVEPQAFLAMSNLRALTSADLWFCQPEAKTGTVSIKYPELQSLRLSGLTPSNIVDIVCPKLKSLTITSSEVTDETIKTIVKKNKLLKDIDLSDCNNLTNDAAIAIAKYCPQLESITLPSGVTNVGWITLVAKCPKLTSINTPNQTEFPQTVEGAQQLSPRLSGIEVTNALNAIKHQRVSIIKG